MVEFRVRAARAGDAHEISAVIVAALRETNARNYSPEIIERLAANFSGTAIEALMQNRTVLVALMRDRIVGTASLEGRALRTMFVAPDVQGRGIGRLLVGQVESIARQAGLDKLALASSITAEPFYAKLGYRFVREAFHDDERTIVMERIL